MRPPSPLPLPPHRPSSVTGRVLASLRNNFFAGVVVVAPIGLTVWLIWTVAGWVDAAVMPLVPRYYHPDAILNRFLGNLRGSEDWVDVNVRGVGVVFFLFFTVLIGWVAKGLIGRSLLGWGEDVVGRVPVIRSIYNAVKQIAETMFAREGQPGFERVCLVEFPTPHLRRIAFLLAPARGEIGDRLGAQGDFVTVFLPNTPNPATGIVMFVHRSTVTELDMSLEDAARLVVSGGLVAPEAAVGPPGGVPGGVPGGPPPAAIPGRSLPSEASGG